jgi:hypothetical protein
LPFYRLFRFFLRFPRLAQENAKRVLILPLTIHSEKDLTFLNQGIMDMMASRISQSATVIRRNNLDPGKDRGSDGPRSERRLCGHRQPDPVRQQRQYRRHPDCGGFRR